MLEKLKNSKLMFWSLELLIVATVIYIATKIDFLFLPIGTFFSTLFAPVLIGGFLYYILNPIVTFLEKKLHMNRVMAIVLVLLVLLGLLVFGLLNLIPNLIEQLTGLATQMPQYMRYFQEWVLGLSKYKMFQNIDLQVYIDKMDIQWSDFLKNLLNSLANSLGSIFSVVTQVVLLACTVPLVLFYMLKDGYKVPDMVLRFFKETRREKVALLLNDMNKTIATYISGQVIECSFVFVMLLVGYWVIGLPYAFLFALIAGLCNLIPYVGPFFGIAPALLATVFYDPVRALLIVGLVVVVQQIDGNFIYPNVIGKTLSIHPLMIIFILLVAGNIAGFVGIFLAIPFFAICKTLIKFVHALLLEQKKEKTALDEPPVETEEKSLTVENVEEL